jgi:hypothetical protein
MLYVASRLVSRIIRLLASEGQAVAECQKTWQSNDQLYFSAFWPQLRRNEAMNILEIPVESGLQRKRGFAFAAREGGSRFPGSCSAFRNSRFSRSF